VERFVDEVNVSQRPILFIIDSNGMARLTTSLLDWLRRRRLREAVRVLQHWDDMIYWTSFDKMHAGNFYGIYGVILVNLSMA